MFSGNRKLIFSVALAVLVSCRASVAVADEPQTASLRGLSDDVMLLQSLNDMTIMPKECPPNAARNATSSGCYCESPNLWTGDACCPANAYYDWTAKKCACYEHFTMDGTSCVLASPISPQCPFNAFWNAENNGCECHEDAVWTGDACCPENSSYDSHTNQCICHEPYKWDGLKCASNEVTVNGQSPVSGCGWGQWCGCGKAGDGRQISMNKFYWNWNDAKVEGCGGGFHLSGFTLNSQWGWSLGISNSQSFDGWEACCNICGFNLQRNGNIDAGWYCEKDFFSTGIWLKGKNKR